MKENGAVNRWRFGACIFYLLALLICVIGGTKFESNIEDVFQWLPDQTDSRAQYDQFVQRFGTDDFLIVTWPGCQLGDSRLDRFDALVKSKDNNGFVARVETSRSVLRTMVRDYRIPLAEALKRLEGLYVGRDGKGACAVMTLTGEGMQHRRDTLEWIKSVCGQHLGIDSDDLVLAGYPVVGDYGDRVVRESLQRALGPCCILSTIVAWICLRNLKMTFAIFATSGLASGLSIAFVTLSGGRWGALSSVIPALAYLLSLSNALHLINYARSPDARRVIFRVIALGWKPCVLSALTTAAGMLSLCWSDYSAIREFGLYCAAGVLGSLVCQLVLMPVLIDFAWREQRPMNNVFRLDRFFDFIANRPKRIAFLFLVFSIIGSAGLPLLTSDLQVERNFSSQSDIMNDIADLEKSLGPVEQTELIIQFPNPPASDFPNRCLTVERISVALRNHPDVSTVFSAVTWLPDPPKGQGIQATVARSVYTKRLTKARAQLAESAYLDVDASRESWRISLRFPYFGETDFAAVDDQLRQIAEDAIRESGMQASVQHTGVVLLYYVAQEQLVGDLFRNFTLAFLAITPLMILVLQSVAKGLIAMIPNVCPAAISYGMLGWIDYPVDIGMVMAACVGLGIAVDDTTHFMLRVDDLQRDSKGNDDRPLRIAYGQCARAMLHTTLISAIGLAAFLPGDLIAMTRFTSLLIAILVVALLCDLILLPALMLITRITNHGSAAK